MALAQNLIILFQFLLLLLLLLIKPSDSICPKSFPCGSLGNLQFPLANQTGCGLFMVDNCDTTNPTIQLGADGYQYDFLANKSKRQLLVSDPYLRYHLNTHFCLGVRNLTLPPVSSPSVRIAIVPNITLFACINQTYNSDAIINRFGGYKYTNCSPWDIYYKKPATSVPSTNLPMDCTVLQVPINSSRDPNTTLSNLLSHSFIVEWNVTEDCFECHRLQGQCLSNSMNQFHCETGAKKKKTKSKSLMIASTGLGVLLIIGLSAYCIIWQRSRRIKEDHGPSKSVSFDRSSKSDVEGESTYFGIHIFSFAELEVATDNFDPSKELGKGGYGTVYYGQLRDEREVAIKRLFESNYRRIEQFMNEIKILTCLRHRNLVSLYGCTSTKSRGLLLVYEYINNGTLYEHLHGQRAKEAKLPWPVRLNIAIETANALTYLHRSDVIHRDVKTCNILLDANFCVKVADFGLSRLFPTDVTHISTAPQGTPGYLDPEYHQCYHLTDKSDVYSFGVVLAELISSMPAVDVKRHRDEINLANLAVNRIQRRVFDELIDPSLGYNRDDEVTGMMTSVAELAFCCLQTEKDMRPSMSEVVDVLRAIQGGEDSKNSKVGGRNNNSNSGRINSGRILRSREMNDSMSLKNKSLVMSPKAVTDSWVSNSSTNTSSIG